MRSPSSFSLSQVAMGVFELFVVALMVMPSGTEATYCIICTVGGTWSEWSDYGLCAMQYGAYSKQRTRTCSNDNCYGAHEESVACVVSRDPEPQPQPVLPTWNQWGSWSECSASCGSGLQSRQRTCNNECSVCDCVGDRVQHRSCQEQSCCSWSNWSSWSQCSVTCGTGGVKRRTRQCSCGNCAVGVAQQEAACSGSWQCPCITCDPPTPPPCNICNTPPPPCVVCGWYGRRKRREALLDRLVANSHHRVSRMTKNQVKLYKNTGHMSH